MSRRPIPQVSITELFEHYDARVVGADASLWRKAQCPVHDDHTPSASVNEDEGRWSCYVCGVTAADAIELVMRKNELGFTAAVQFLEGFAQRGGRAVQPQRSGGGLLPRGSRRDGTRGRWVPPWSRL